MNADFKKGALIIGAGFLTAVGMWLFQRHALPRLPVAIR